MPPACLLELWLGGQKAHRLVSEALLKFTFWLEPRGPLKVGPMLPALNPSPFYGGCPGGK